MRYAIDVVRQRMTADEQQRTQEIIEELRRIRRELLEKRGGRLFSSSTDLLREAREERAYAIDGSDERDGGT